MKYVQPYGISDPDASYINGNPSTGTMGSIPPAASIEHPQREIVRMIQASGITPSDTSLDQLALAIQNGKINFAVDAGTANAMVLVLDPAPAPITLGMRIWLKRALTNTGATTLSVNGVIKDVKRNNGNAAVSGDLFAGGIFGLAYDGTVWRIVAGLSFETTITQQFMSNAAFPVEVRYISSGSYNWTVPAGVYVAQAECYGAGGGGGTGSAGYVGGAGGGGGGYTRKKVAVSPGQVKPVVVGAGGSSGAAGTATGGGSGGLSSFMGMVAGGGGGADAGINPIPGTPSSSIPGTATGGDVNLPGNYGSSGASGGNTTGEYTGYGGLGGAGAGPEGGSGGMMSTGGSGPGTGYGAGGSGGGSATGINAAGGPGHPGAVIIKYVLPS